MNKTRKDPVCEPDGINPHMEIRTAHRKSTTKLHGQDAFKTILSPSEQENSYNGGGAYGSQYPNADDPNI